MYTVLETSAPPATVMAAARAALTSIDPAVPLYFAETLGARYDSSLAVPRFTAGLVARSRRWRWCSPASACSA